MIGRNAMNTRVNSISASDLFNKSWDFFYHTGYWSSKAMRAFSEAFAQYDSLDDQPLLWLNPVGRGNVVLRSPLGEVCIYLNSKMRHWSAKSAEDSYKKLIVKLRMTVCRYDSSLHMVGRDIMWRADLPPDTQRLVEFEAASATVWHSSDDDFIKSFRGEPLADPFKIYALEGVYDEILDKMSNGLEVEADELRSKAREILS